MAAKKTKKEEMNDIIQFLIPSLEKVKINKSHCKIDVTTEKTGNKRGDIWISLQPQSNKAFEKSIICLIEAKHKKCVVGDMDWRDAMRQGLEKSQKHKLNYYVVTNCVTETRYYNCHNDEEIALDGKLLNHLVSIEILKKIQHQVSKDVSSVIHKTVTLGRPFSESKFRNSLSNLANIYRSAGIKNGDERIEPTISFVVLKYIDEYEKAERKLNKVIKLWGDFKKIATEESDGDLQVEFKQMVDLIWYNDTYKENEYQDFKDLIKFDWKRLTHDHFIKIYNELNQYDFHGANFDLFGAIYEEFASQTKKKEFGEFYTRRHITGLVSRLLLRNELTPRNLNICDPSCGAGGFLTEAFKALVTNYSANSKLNEKTKKQLKEDVFWGYDNDDKSVARTKLNMFLVGDGHVHIYDNDSLKGWNENKGWGENTFDYILSNPPMGKYEGDADMNSFLFTNERRMELLFAEKIINSTQFGGEIAIVLNDGALETPSRQNFRLNLLKHCDIYAIISLTKFAFAPYTKEKTYILFMRKKQEEDIGDIQKFPIWQYVLDYDGYANSDKRYKTKYNDDLTEIENIFSDAVNHAKYYPANLNKFNSGKNNFERQVNERELSEGLTGYKFKYVDISQVNAENYYNLITEFHLRPFEIPKLNIDNLATLSKKLLKTSIPLSKPSSFSSEKLGDMFSLEGGNSGLTEDFVYHNQPNTDEEKIKILSSATVDQKQMGYLSKHSKINNTPIKIFSGETILIARNGTYAGIMNYFENDSYTTNDHTYVMRVLPDWKGKLDLRFIAFYLQPLFFNIVTSKSDNATFNKEYAERQVIKVPDYKYQKKIGNLLRKLDEAKNEIQQSLLNVNSLLLCEIV